MSTTPKKYDLLMKGGEDQLDIIRGAGDDQR